MKAGVLSGFIRSIALPALPEQPPAFWKLGAERSNQKENLPRRIIRMRDAFAIKDNITRLFR